MESSQAGAVGNAGQSSGESQGVGAGGNTPAGGLNAPNVIDLAEDSMVRLPGQKDPVKYGDYYRNFQSQFTKKSQEAAAAAKRSAALEAQHAEATRRLQAYEQAQGRQQQPNPTADLTAKLKSLSYLSGEDAAGVVNHLMQQFSTQEQALEKRDLAIGLLYKRLQEMGTQFQGIQSRHTQSDFDSKITKYVSDLGLPVESAELAKEIYLAYEGDDLDTEFPNILRNRWEQIQNIVKKQNQSRIEAARNKPFVPGKGGSASPSNRLQNMAKMSAKQIADELWPGAVNGEVET